MIAIYSLSHQAELYHTKVLHSVSATHGIVSFFAVKKESLKRIAELDPSEVITLTKHKRKLMP